MAMCVKCCRAGNQAKETAIRHRESRYLKQQGRLQNRLNLNTEGFPGQKEPITLTVYEPDQNQAKWDEVLVLQKYEEMSNIHMDYQEVPQDGFEENKQLLFKLQILNFGCLFKGRLTLTTRYPCMALPAAS